MKKNLLLLTLSVFYLGICAQNTITTTVIPSNYCVGQILAVHFTATGTFDPANNFTLELSDENGIFPGTTPGQIACNTGCDSIQITLPENTIAGSHYRFRVSSTAPVIIGSDNGSDITIHSRPKALAAANYWTPVVGAMLNFSGTGLGGSGIYTSFKWTGPGAYISYQQNPVIQSAVLQNSGAYSFMITDNFGCSSNNNPVLDILVNSQQLILSQPGLVSLTAGSNASFSVTPYFSATCIWQETTDHGTSWTNLSNSGVYQNTTTYNLTVAGVTSALDGNAYRCKLNFPGIGIAYTRPTVLVLKGDTIITWIDSLNICPEAANGIHIPVKVKNFSNVASVSLSILYSDSDFQFVSFANINPLLAPAGFVISNTLQGNDQYDSRFGWYANSIYPLDLPDSATLFEIVVDFTGNASSFQFNPEIWLSQYSSINGDIIPAIFNPGYLQKMECKVLKGTLTYDNSESSALANQHILLKKNGVVKYEAYTDSDGNYLIDGVNTGQYDVEVLFNGPWSQTSSIDALIGAEYFVGMTQLTLMKKAAADVNQSGYVNALDCMQMLERSVGYINYYPGGDWKISANQVNISATGGQQILNIKAICSGDLNGSFTTP